MVSSRTKNKAAENRPPCIWMQAGVVRHKKCKIDFHCEACQYDRALRRAARENREIRQQGRRPAGRRGKIVFWKDRLRELAVWKQPCVHHMKGRIDFRACTNDYQCGNCEFDQYFSDQYTVHAVVRPVDVLDVKGFKLPHGYYLHQGHAWVKIEEGSAVRIGLDDFALRLLGPLDRIEAPLMGKTVEQGRGDILLNRSANTARLQSPVSGVVTDINPALREKGSLANQDPYTQGWVMRLHASHLRHDLKNLMIGEQAGEYLDEEVDQLYRVIEAEAGPLAADGGYLADDIYGNLPGASWQKLTRLFLRT
ncbi:MAG: glycine cleavage system protein H [Desulfobacterales bacterium]|nr:MAG: glycine cleavage system protein H [Desulfobacterales bacterium]